MTDSSRDWPLYEIFIRARSGLDHKHVGSLHATDARMAIEHARDLYTRRQEGISIWAVRSGDIVAPPPPTPAGWAGPGGAGVVWGPPPPAGVCGAPAEGEGGGPPKTPRAGRQG